MDKDRVAIEKILADMFDAPDKNGIYPTSTAYTRLEHYIESQRVEAIGWMHANACVALDNGNDPRLENVPEMLARAQKDLGV
jgi:hypothetical protein